MLAGGLHDRSVGSSEKSDEGHPERKTSPQGKHGGIIIGEVLVYVIIRRTQAEGAQRHVQVEVEVPEFKVQTWTQQASGAHRRQGWVYCPHLGAG